MITLRTRRASSTDGSSLAAEPWGSGLDAKHVDQRHRAVTVSLGDEDPLADGSYATLSRKPRLRLIDWEIQFHTTGRKRTALVEATRGVCP